MALSYKARRRWALITLVLGLPIYIILCVATIALFDRPSFVVELCVYIGLGLLWAIPLKSLFKGIGQADPDAQDD